MLLPSFVTLSKGLPRRFFLKITLLIISTYILISFFLTQLRIWSHIGALESKPPAKTTTQSIEKTNTKDDIPVELLEDPTLQTWQTLLEETPSPKEGSETWIIDQAFLYSHINKLREFKQTNGSSLSTTPHQIINKIASDLHHYETLAFPFLSGGHGLDTVKQFHRKSKDPLKRRGLVIVAGKKQYRFLLHLLTSLRQVLHTEIPVEVFYRGVDDLSSQQLSVLTTQFTNVTTRNLLAIPLWNESHAGLTNAGFALKPFAMLASEFAEPILCDADTIFLQDAYTLYEEKPYNQTGTLFYHDRAIYSGWRTREWVRQQFNLITLSSNPTGPSDGLKNSWFWRQGSEIHFQESGVVLLDKSKDEVLLGLMLITWMNSRRPREYLKKYMWGDKETFWTAFEFLKIPYEFVQRYGGAIGKLEGDAMKVDNILHFDSAFEPVWMNGGLLQTKLKRNSPWLVVDTYGIDDGRWKFGWVYSNATWKSAPELGRLFGNMTKAAEDMEDKFLHRNIFQWMIDGVLDRFSKAA